MSTHSPTDKPFAVYGTELDSRFLIGSALYPSPQIMADSIQASGAQVVTLSLRRQSALGAQGNQVWELIKQSGCHLLPNTAGCKSVKEAVTLAQMAREVFATDWIKLELIGDDYNLQPDPIALVEATRILVNEGFKVLPYTTDDLVVAQKLAELGCEVIMPWGAPIGTGKGVLNPYALETLRARLPEMTLIVDAGLGLPSHAAQVMEMGFDGVLLNSAVALSVDPVRMAAAFGKAIAAGRDAFLAGPMPERATASPSTPTLGTPFWHQSSAQQAPAETSE